MTNTFFFDGITISSPLWLVDMVARALLGFIFVIYSLENADVRRAALSEILYYYTVLDAIVLTFFNCRSHQETN